MTIGDCLLITKTGRPIEIFYPSYPYETWGFFFPPELGTVPAPVRWMAWWQTRAEVIIMRDFPRFHTLNSAGVFFRGVDHCGNMFHHKETTWFGGFWWGFEGPHVLARWKWRAFFQLQHIKWYISRKLNGRKYQLSHLQDIHGQFPHQKIRLSGTMVVDDPLKSLISGGFLWDGCLTWMIFQCD